MKLKKTLYGFGIVFGLSAALLFVAPYFISLETFKPLLISKVASSLGRDVRFDGPIRLRLVPTPSIVIERVSVANAECAVEPTMITLPKVRADLALLPLFKKQVRFTHIQLINPTVHLEALSNGKGNWDCTPASSSTAQPPQGTSVHQDYSLDFAFDKIELLRARITWRSQDNERRELQDVSALLHMESLTGPLEARGAFMALDQHVEFHLNMRKLMDKTPVKLILNTKGLDLSLKGDLLPDTKGFQGTMTLASDIDDMEKLFNIHTSAPEFLREPFKLTGYVQLSPNGANFQHLELAMEETRLEGNGELTLAPLSFACDVRGLPGGVALRLKGTPHAGGLSGHMSLVVKSPRKLLRWTRLVDDKTLPSHLLDAPWDFETAFAHQKDHVRLTGTRLVSDAAGLEGALSLDIKSLMLNYDVILRATRAFLQASHVPLNTHLENVRFKGSTRLLSLEPEIATDTKIMVAGNTLGVKGTLEMSSEKGHKIDLDMHMKIDTPLTFGDALVLEEGTLATKCHATKNDVRLENIHAKLTLGSAPISFKGAANIHLAGKPMVQGELTFAPLRLDSIFQKKRVAQMPALMLVSHHPHHQKPSSQNPWSKEPLDLSWLNSINADLVFVAPMTEWSDLKFEGARKHVVVQDGKMSSQVQARLWDGRFYSAATLTAQNGATMSFKSGLDDASMKKILDKVDTGKFKIVRGTLDGLTSLRASGRSVWELVNALEGTMSLNVINGTVAGFNLKELSQKLKDAKDIKGLLSLFTGSLTQGVTDFSEARLALEFHKGVGRIGKLILTADAAALTGSGAINIPAYMMDVLTTIQLTQHMDIPPFHVRLSGPLNAPEQSYDFSDVQAYMLTHMFSKILGKKGSIQDTISSLIGEKEKSANENTKATDNAPSQKDDSTPEEVVRNITKDPAKAIGGLLKGLL